MTTMATITDHVDDASGIAFFEVAGAVSADDMIAVARERPSFRAARHLVDMTKASFHLLDSDSLRAIAEAFTDRDHNRPDGQTAILVSSNMAGTIASLYAALSANAGGNPIAYNVTSSRSAALAWLSGQDGPC